jgi:hypothetical protein
MSRHALTFILVAFALPIAAGAQTVGAGPLPKEVAAACDALHALMVKTPGITARRRSGSIADEMLRAPIAACAIDLEGSFKKLGKARQPTDRAAGYFDAQKWAPLPEFSADGPDGTVFAYRNRSVACLVRGEWDGGSDDEPNQPAADPYRVTVLCGTAGDFVRPQ